jgi:hypothetical protein
VSAPDYDLESVLVLRLDRHESTVGVLLEALTIYLVFFMQLTTDVQELSDHALR